MRVVDDGALDRAAVQVPDQRYACSIVTPVQLFNTPVQPALRLINLLDRLIGGKAQELNTPVQPALRLFNLLNLLIGGDAQEVWR